MVLFYLLKTYARLALRIFCRRVIVNKPEYLRAKGPLLFAANHPNSFLDGIILTTLLDEHLYALARGDAFTPRWNRLLRWLHLLPVYRTSEGVANLGHNYTTFAACHEVFEQGGLVLIFSEGACKNEWKLRPLRKGTARLVISAWNKGIPLTVVPLGFNYSSFGSFGKNVHLHFGEPLQQVPVMQQGPEGRQFAAFNLQLQEQLRKLVYDIEPEDKESLKRHFAVPVPLVRKVLLALPAGIGWLVHAPLYYLARKAAGKIEKEHFDGVLVGLLLLLYPCYLLLLVLLASNFIGWAALALLIFLPFCGWAAVQLKPQID